MIASKDLKIYNFFSSTWRRSWGKGDFSGKSFKEGNLGNEGLVDGDSEKDSYESGAWIRRG
jgi:hypothetical protein